MNVPHEAVLIFAGLGVALLVAAYALSPIDLIPDFIPVLGYLDDLLLVPLGLLLVIRMLPPEVLADARSRAAATLARPRSVASSSFAVSDSLPGNSTTR